MKRYNGSGYLSDDFNYSYISGTNKLNLVTGDETQYTYDNNGNLLSDIMNLNYDMKYDYRNLLIESKNTSSPNVTFFTKYYYDEAGNRIRQWTYHSTNGGGTNEGDSWSTDNNEYYLRDVSGKEIDIYYGNNLSEWNVYGIDNVGKINNNRERNFYIKDHLGSIRAVINGSNNVVTYADYDPWGFYLRGGGMRYGFTSKEKDKDFVNNYNYFGARYYDARIGRWGGVEPLLDKYVSWSSYQYALCNPIRLFDADGSVTLTTTSARSAFLDNVIKAEFKEVSNNEFSGLMEQLLNSANYDLIMTDYKAEEEKDPDSKEFAAGVDKIGLNDTKGNSLNPNGLGIRLFDAFFTSGNKYISAVYLDHEMYHLQYYYETEQLKTGSAYVEWKKENVEAYIEHEKKAIDRSKQKIKDLYKQGKITKKEKKEAIKNLNDYEDGL